MANWTGKTWLKVAGVVGVSALVVWKGPKLLNLLAKAARSRPVTDTAAQTVDDLIGWDKLPVWLGLLDLVGIRNILREKNLFDTSTPGVTVPITPPADLDIHKTRTIDGTFNDLGCPVMGSSGTRFGRNAPLDKTFPEDEAGILSPSPRLVSRELMTRHEFQPATTLNILAAAWLQFMIRDWFSHGKSQQENPWQVPLPAGDDWPQDPMTILRTAPDPTRCPADAGTPPTYINTETHWWDASQIYGTTADFQAKVRTHTDGKLTVGRDDLVDVDAQSLVQQAGLAGWWVGQSLMFTLFTLEHNAICDRLKAANPQWSDEEIFQHARLVNAALIAKIHTVEWTTAILGHPTLQIAMRTNWWGVLGEHIHNLVGRVSPSEVLSGIPGSTTDHFGVPYSITEEFVAVYRMHPLIPDDYTFRSVSDDSILHQASFPELAGLRADEILDTIPMTDLFYSFGVAHPGAVVLHNYPRGLQHFMRPDGRLIDLCAHDILRVRELGVPRYCEFRRVLHLKAPQTFEELTPNPDWREEIRRVYDGDIERVDLMVGLYAEQPPKGFGFSDTAFRIFALMASRRLNSDRFFTTDFTTEVYSPAGMQWIDENTMSSVLLRHYPSLAPALRGVKNAFAPWTRTETGMAK